MTPVMNPQLRQTAKRAALAALGLSVLSVVAGAVHMVSARGQVTEFHRQIDSRAARLHDDRQFVSDAPKTTKVAALDRSSAVACLRSKLIALASEKNFTIQEFQAATDEAAYMTLYAQDNKDPGWMQVSIHVSLTGSSTVLAAALAALRDLEVPFEIDNIEFTRRSTDNSGVAVVSEQIQLRVLFYQGGA